jgi:hypothetical protein
MPFDMQESQEARRERLMSAAFRYFDPQGITPEEEYADVYLENTFDDSVILRDEVTEKMFNVPYTFDDDNNVLFGIPQEVTPAFVEKSRSEKTEISMNQVYNRAMKGTQVSGPIVSKSATNQIAYAPVLVPGEEDSDGEEVTIEKIEKAAHEWMASYRNVDYQHSLNNVGAPVESYISTEDREVEQYGETVIIPKGSWILGTQLQDAAWKEVQDGNLTGLSVMGVRRSAEDTAIKNAENFEAATKRTLLQELGDWVPTHVSVVSSPAVNKAKFFAFKSKGQPSEGSDEPEGSIPNSAKTVEANSGDWKEAVKEKMKGWVTMPNSSTKAGRSLSTANENKLRNAISEIMSVLGISDQEGTADDENRSTNSTEGTTSDESQKQSEGLTADSIRAIIAEEVQKHSGGTEEGTQEGTEGHSEDENDSGDEEPSDDENNEGEGTEGDTEGGTEAAEKSAAEKENERLKKMLAQKGINPDSSAIDETEGVDSSYKSTGELLGRDSMGRRIR